MTGSPTGSAASGDRSTANIPFVYQDEYAMSSFTSVLWIVQIPGGALSSWTFGAPLNDASCSPVATSNARRNPPPAGYRPESHRVPAGIRPDVWAQVALTSDGASETVVGYMNGVRQFYFADARGSAMVGGDTLRFFRDDDATHVEHTAGAVARIRLFAGALTGAEVEALACEEVPAVICGTEGNDVMTGTPGDDVILAFGGDDTIQGVDGDDFLSGGSGSDRLVGGEGNDVALGGLDADVLEGGGIDILRGGKGQDELTGGPSPDALIGGPGRDRCVGRPRRDFFRGCE